MSDSADTRQALKPHTIRDLYRAGIAITFASVPPFTISWRFFQGTDALEHNAAWSFAAVGVMLFAVGLVIIATARKKGAPEEPDPTAR